MFNESLMSDNSWQNRIIGYKQIAANQLLANPDNPRRHPAAQREALRGSMDTLGIVAPVLYNVQTGYLLDGHARVEEALTKDENMLLPVLEVDISEAEEKIFLASFDWITTLATYDKDVLANLLHSLNTDEPRLQATLADLAETNDLYFGDDAPEPIDPEPQIDRAEELNEKWQVKKGDLWQIGKHWLLCGDSTSEADVERVMGGERADAVVTDSPYGINKEGIVNDSPDTLSSLFNKTLNCFPVDNAVVINFQSPRLFPLWVDAIRDAGHKFERALWFYDKTDITFPWRGWLMCSQIALVSSVGKPQWSEDVYSHDCYLVKDAGKQEGVGGHTTAKPLSVIADLVKHTYGIVYDPFGGSGTTMVACQQLGRRCRMIEIEPKYCAVILERMSDMGITPELITDSD